ncbi:hypothetical protein B4098_1036 [Heyndrickxia coagulans]|uniref:Uncharacterized protein n=1 Tax=Heyndrickxia coagulans TaxID=1398 RepID=A0A150JZV3_HEYCO|nr:hypothetical protein B4098_1036 [Heyndrickxia coagulans]
MDMMTALHMTIPPKKGFDFAQALCSLDDGLASHAILPGKRFTDKLPRLRYR